MKNDQLCKGFEITRIDYANNAILSTLFAQLPDGEILVSNEHQRDNSFDLKGRVWSRAERIEDGAYFIGNYHIPTVTEEACA